MRTLAQVAVSILAAILVCALAALGMGCWDALLYWASAFVNIRHMLQPYEINPVDRYLPVAGLLSLLVPSLAAIVSFLLVFHRLHYGRWLPRRIKLIH
jgi:hypothetical protein